jgi:hypothetical protein
MSTLIRFDGTGFQHTKELREIRFPFTSVLLSFPLTSILSCTHQFLCCCCFSFPECNVFFLFPLFVRSGGNPQEAPRSLLLKIFLFFFFSSDCLVLVSPSLFSVSLSFSSVPSHLSQLFRSVHLPDVFLQCLAQYATSQIFRSFFLFSLGFIKRF